MLRSWSTKKIVYLFLAAALLVLLFHGPRLPQHDEENYFTRDGGVDSVDLLSTSLQHKNRRIHRYASRVSLLHLPHCVFPTDCQLKYVASRRQHAVVPKMTSPGLSKDGRKNTDAVHRLLQRRREKDAQGEGIKGAAFVVEDGCAMGHMLKDVGAFMHAAMWLQVHAENESGAAAFPLYLVFANACASESEWQLADVHATKPRTLFSAVLVHWWRGAVEYLRVLAPSIRVHPIFSHLGRETHIGITTTTSPLLLFRRPLHWRWFHSQEDAHAFRTFMLDTYFTLGSEKKEKEGRSRISIVVVEREASRHFRERDVVDALRRDLVVGVQTTASLDIQVSLQRLESSALSYRDQVRILRDADIVIASHGAALASVVFMAPHSIVIELFPAQFMYWIYYELSVVSGLQYQQIHGARAAPVCAKKGCRPMTSAADDHQEGWYARLRQWNGFGKCKNCDILWCRDDKETTEALPTIANESKCMQRTLLPIVRASLQQLLLVRIRRGDERGDDGVVDSTWWLDRRG